MNSYYYYNRRNQWKWWSGRLGMWLEPTTDGRRYPAVNIVILTPDTFRYAVAIHALGDKPILTKPPQDNSPDHVISIKDMKEWQSRWDRAAPHKLLVYEFYDKKSTLYKAMDELLEDLAKKYKGQAEFCKLDVDNFELLARICGVEGAYPTFVLFKNCKQVGKVVGINKEDELKQSIEKALTD